MKKILFITHSYAMAGGAEDEFERLLKYFFHRQHKYEIHCLSPDGERTQIYRNYCAKLGLYLYGHLPVVYENLWGYLKYFLKAIFQIYQIYKFVVGQKYDLVVINVVVLIWPALLVSFLGMKTVVFIREDIQPKFIRHIVYRLLSHSCSFFISNSITKMNDFIQTTKVLRIEAIYPAIDIPLRKNERHLSSVLGMSLYSRLLNKDQFIFVNIAKVLKKKNQLLILKSLKELKRLGLKNDQLPLILLIGRYDLKDQYMMDLSHFISENNLEDSCLFLGEIDRYLLYQIYEYIDSVIITSFSEGLPVVLVESFKFGKPVISTKVGGIPEIVKNNENGILIDFDFKQLSEQMSALISDKKLYDSISENAKISYEERFNLQKILLETERVFQNVMNKG